MSEPEVEYIYETVPDIPHRPDWDEAILLAKRRRQNDPRLRETQHQKLVR